MPAANPHRPRLRSAAQIACTLALILIAGGCTRLVYNRLDSLGGWYLGSLVSLTSEQRADLRGWLTHMLDWHRASELGQYAQFLHELAGQLAARGNRAVYERVADRLEAFGQAVVRRATPEAARLLMSLTDEQLDELDANLEERAQERAEESRKALERGVWRKERERDLQRQVKRWTGEVTHEQRALISRAVANFEPTSEEWLHSQRQWRKMLMSTLHARAPDREARVSHLLREPNRCWTPEYVAKNDRNRERTLALIDGLDGSLTPKQRERLQGELTELARELEDLQET